MNDQDQASKRTIFVFPWLPVEDGGEADWYKIEMPLTPRFSEALHHGDATAWSSLIEVCEKLIERAAGE